MVDDHTLAGAREPTTQRGVSRRNVLTAVGGASIAGMAGCLGQLTEEEEWPSRQVEIVSPWAAGGGADTTSRAIAEAAENYTEVSWNVSNQTGGSGSIGMSAVADSGSDGHTLGVIAPEICLFQHLDIADLGPEDVKPIMQYSVLPAVLVVHEDAEYTSVEEFIAYGTENQEQIQLGNSGTGSSWHMALAGFANEAGIEVEHVPYDGANPAITAVVNGEVDATAGGPAEVAGQVLDGPLTAIGVMHNERVEPFSDTPTMQEQGVDVELGSWLGAFTSTEVPDETHSSIVDVYQSVYEDEEFQSFMEDSGNIPVNRGPDETQEFLDEQYEYYGELVAELDIG